SVTGCTVNWSPDGRLLVSGDLEGYIRLWEIPENGLAKCLQVFAGHATFVDALTFSPDGRILASTSFDGTVKLWDLINDQFYPRKTIVGHLARIGRLAWSPDGHTLACGGIDKMIWLVDVEKGSYRTVLQGHEHHISGLAFMPDGSSLLSGGGNALHQWDVINMHCMRTVEGYSKSLYAVDWSPDSTHVIGGGIDKIVTLWNLSDDTLPYSLYGHAGAVCGVGWNPHGKWLASSEWNNVIRLWDTESGICLKTLQYPNDPDNVFYALAWSPDGERLAVGTGKHGVQIFESETYHQPWIGNEFPTWIRRVVWSPDGRLLAGAGDDGIVYVWDATDGTLHHQLTGHRSMVLNLAWSPDGTQLASGGRGIDGGELFVWDAQNDYRLQVIENHPGIVYAIAWGITEDILVSGDDAGILRWWSVKSGECLFVRHVHMNRIQALSRSPDGTKLASCGNDGAIVIWDLQSGEHLQTLRRDRPYERLNITGIRGLTEAQMATLRILGAVEDTV
ncbi:MAG: WD40 repeat domain-containing protein, partial [Chloroflexota bacterium]